MIRCAQLDDEIRCSDMFDTRRLLRVTHDVSSAMQPSATFCYLNIDLECAPCMMNCRNNVLRVSLVRVLRTLRQGEFGLRYSNIHKFVLNVYSLYSRFKHCFSKSKFF